jgi:methylthioribose-1-phosphate isomerase
MAKALEWKQQKLFIIDQSKLPAASVKVQLRSLVQIMEAIKQKKANGNALVGVLAAFGIYYAVKQPPLANSFEKLRQEVEKISAQFLKLSPVAMDLEWVLERMKRCILNNRDHKLNTLRDLVLREAVKISKEFEEAGKSIVDFSQELIREGDSILTYGHAGSYSSVGAAHPLAVIARAKSSKTISVIVPETRPMLEGARLTALELKQARVPFHLVCDNAVGHLMKDGRVNIVMVSAYRIAMNGDVIAPVGTYSLAMLAYHHQIPLYVVAPTTSFDRTLISAEPVLLADYNPDQILKWQNKPVSVPGVKVLAPAFDNTEHKYISALVTDLGIVRAPYDQKLNNLLSTLA